MWEEVSHAKKGALWEVWEEVWDAEKGAVCEAWEDGARMQKRAPKDSFGMCIRL